MTYEVNDTISNIPDLFESLGQTINVFGLGIVVFIWALITLTGYFAQDRRGGRGNMPMWLTIGGFFTTIIAFILFLFNGIISLYIVTVCIVLFIVFAGWFLFSSERE